MKTFLRQFRPAALLLGALTVLTGFVYPALIAVLARTLFPYAAGGSLILRDGKVVGSELIGQAVSDPGRFWGRPSATSPFPCNAASSSGSNLGPTNPALIEAVKARIEALRRADPGNAAPIPADLVTASASGLDPHISPEAALYQAGRVARARGLSEQAVGRLVESRVEDRTLGVLGEPRVNVLRLNLALDELAGKSLNTDRNP